MITSEKGKNRERKRKENEINTGKLQRSAVLSRHRDTGGLAWKEI